MACTTSLRGRRATIRDVEFVQSDLLALYRARRGVSFFLGSRFGLGTLSRVLAPRVPAPSSKIKRLLFANLTKAKSQLTSRAGRHEDNHEVQLRVDQDYCLSK